MSPPDFSRHESDISNPIFTIQKRPDFSFFFDTLKNSRNNKNSSLKTDRRSIFNKTNSNINKKKYSKKAQANKTNEEEELKKAQSIWIQTEIEKISTKNRCLKPLFWLVFCLSLLISFMIGFSLFSREESLGCGELKSDIGNKHYLREIYNYRHLEDRRDRKIGLDVFRDFLLPRVMLAFFTDSSLFERNNPFITINSACRTNNTVEMERIMSDLFPAEEVVRQKEKPEKDVINIFTDKKYLSGSEVSLLFGLNYMFNQYPTTRLVTNIRIEFQEVESTVSRFGRIRRNENFFNRDSIEDIPVNYIEKTNTQYFYLSPYKKSPDQFIKKFKSLNNAIVKSRSFSFYKMKFSYINLGTMHLGTQTLGATYSEKKLVEFQTKFSCTPPNTTLGSSFRILVLLVGFIILLVHLFYYFSIFFSIKKNIQKYYAEIEKKTNSINILKSFSGRRSINRNNQRSPLNLKVGKKKQVNLDLSEKDQNSNSENLVSVANNDIKSVNIESKK